MDGKKYLTMYIVVFILVSIVAATGGSLLTSLTGLNSTFGSTGLGSLFSASIVGIIFAAAIFYAIWRAFGNKK